MTTLLSSTINSIIHEKGSFLFSELSVVSSDVFVTSSVMTVHNHSIYYSNDVDTDYEGSKDKQKSDSTSLVPKCILSLFKAPSLEVKRAAIVLCLTMWSSNPKAVSNLKDDDSKGKWLYRVLPYIIRLMLNQQKDDDNRVELITIARHESVELLLYFYSDRILQYEVIRYLVSIILLQTFDGNTANPCLLYTSDAADE